MDKKELKTIRLWNPLFPKTYERDSDGHLANYPTDVSSEEVVSYLEKILAVIDKLKLPDEGERGLAIYLDDVILAQKVYSINPTVEEWEGRLWGITEIQFFGTLDDEEYDLLVSQLTGQLADGWGEVLEQLPINTPDGELYISFWDCGKNFFIKPEEEVLREFSQNTEYSMR